MPLSRRDLLYTTAIGGSLGFAGCLERLGFEEQSAWDTPPMVDDRPDAVYIPSSSEEMGVYGRASDGEYVVELSFTFPHRFWLVAGDRERVDVQPDDTLHLMMTVWDDVTGVVLPVDMGLEIVDADGDLVHGDTPWSMLSQRMGFHYGDNVTLPGEGRYTARMSVGPVTTRRTGDLEGRLESLSTLEVDFEYARSDIHDLSLNLTDEDERGTRGALPLMDHSDHGDHAGESNGDRDESDGHDSDDDSHSDHDDHGDHDDSHSDHDDHGDHTDHPTSRGPAVDSLHGTLLGTETTGDAAIAALVTDLERFSENGDPYLAVCPRTPYNDVILPFMSLSTTFEAEGSTLLESRLVETIDHEFGHHYGLAAGELEQADRVTVTVDTPPQVSRHDGYETAFFEFDPITFEL
ncbi:iron transporter [Natronosalvus vescus]|uniref:iron transporter n=1 Tax=Natronosalvus vescus TaxID=2953881 RepID=UPI0020915346|nr:iron transporter [Natronosalvus vescus]